MLDLKKIRRLPKGADIQNAGFAKPECFWRNLNFAGWVARKKADV